MTCTISNAIITKPNQTRVFHVLTRGEYIAFESTLTDEDATQVLHNIPGDFARSLRTTVPPTAKQLAWIHRLAMDYKQKQQSPASDFGPLFNAFDFAQSNGAKRLTLRFEGINIKPNRDNSVLWVTSQTEQELGQYGLKPKYLGKITRQALDPRLPDDVKTTILSAAKDPLSAAIQFGKISGSCSCCGRELTDPVSIDRGIGPICAQKFGW